MIRADCCKLLVLEMSGKSSERKFVSEQAKSESIKILDASETIKSVAIQLVSGDRRRNKKKLSSSWKCNEKSEENKKLIEKI